MKKSEIIAKEKATKDLAFLSKMANRNLFAKNNGEHELLMNDAVTWYQAGLIPEQDMYMYLYLYYLSTCLYRYTQQHKDDEQQPLHSWEIDTGRLKPGDMFPNYKKLCEHLGVQPKSGKGRKLQEDMFRRYFDYQKVEGSQAIIIMDVYSEPQDRTEYRNAKFINQIKVLIMAKLCEEYHDGKARDNTIIYNTSYSNLMKKLNLVNFYFWGKGDSKGENSSLNYFLKTYPQLFSYDSNMKDNNSFLWNSRFFFSITMNKIKDAIRSALNSLQKDDIITYKPGYMILLSDTRQTKRLATDKEEAILKEIRKEIAESMGYRNSHIACFYKPDEFYRQFRNRIMERFGWKDAYFNIRISITVKNLFREISSYTAFPIEHSAAIMSGDEMSYIHNTYEQNMIEAVSDYAFTKYKKEEPGNAEHIAADIHDDEDSGFNDISEQDIIEILNITDLGKAGVYNQDFVKRMSILAKTLIPIESGIEIEEVMDNMSESEKASLAFVSIIE